MLGNRRRDTSPQCKVRRLLHARGLRYRGDLPLPFDRRRRADITFTRAKVAVFIDGCFWRGCPQHYLAPKSHAEFGLDLLLLFLADALVVQRGSLDALDEFLQRALKIGCDQFLVPPRRQVSPIA